MRDVVGFKALEIDFHRNGIGGAGFHVVRFTYREDGKRKSMVAVVFNEPGYVSVFDYDLWRCF